MEETMEIRSDEEKRKQVAAYNLTSDLFAGKVFEDLGACQELCRILLQDDRIVLKSVKTQYAIRNLKTHSVELDILAEDMDGNFINFEIQMYREKAPFKRTRYYLSCIDTDILEKGKAYYDLPNATIVYITKGDFLGDERGYYHIGRKAGVKDITARLDNGLCEKYYNLEYPTDDMKINELLRYFVHSDPFYKTENFPRIVERVRYFKIKKEGVTIMCEIADRIRREGREEGRREGENIGRVKGKVESILELLADLGEIPQKTTSRIRQETDLEQLGRWLKCAAKASSFTEFETSAGLS